MTRLTYHLVPAADWAATDRTRPYEAASLASAGFIHCTDGDTELLRTVDRHYGDDPRPFAVLTVDLDRVTAPWRIEDAGGIYPHVFGPIDQPAIVAVGALIRGPDGRAVAIDAPASDRAVGANGSLTQQRPAW